MRLTLYVPAPELASGAADGQCDGSANAAPSSAAAAAATGAGKARRTTLRQAHRRGAESTKPSAAVEQPRSGVASGGAQSKPADFLELEFSLSGAQRRDEASIAKLLLAGAAVGRSASFGRTA